MFHVKSLNGLPSIEWLYHQYRLLSWSDWSYYVLPNVLTIGTGPIYLLPCRASNGSYQVSFVAGQGEKL